MNVSEKQEKAATGGTGAAVQKCAIIVVIDPGHGDQTKAKLPIDPGALAAPKSTIYEKDIALAIAISLRTKLQAKTDEIEAVYLTREGDVVKIDQKLQWRVDFAKEKKANIFVSLHLDSADASASGQSALYHSSYTHSKALASSISVNAKVIAARKYGLKADDHLFLLKLDKYDTAVTKAAVLIELGFITNETDRTACQTRGSEIADEITTGIVAFVQANKAIFAKK